MSEQFNVDLPARFIYKVGEQADKEKQLEEYLSKLTIQVDEMFKRVFNRVTPEEGDWTAGFTCSTSGTITISPTQKTGAYVKIGRMVTITGYFLVDSVSSPVGALTLTGLPFTCGNGVKFDSTVALGCGALEATAITTVMGRVLNNTKTIYLWRFAAGTAADMAADVKANSHFEIGATYFTD